MEGEVLWDDQWARIEVFVLSGRKGRRGRLFVDALLWMARSSSDGASTPRAPDGCRS